jgi:hypothetical protein
MKLKNLIKESQNLDYRRMNIGEKENEKGMTNEEKRAFLEAVASYHQFGEMISHKGNLSEIHENIKTIVENASSLTIKETGDWFDRVTVQRHMKSMNESYKVFSNSISEVVQLQQRLESAYDEIGEVLGKYYEIKEGNTFGAERAKAIAGNEDSFEVDGKSYKVTGVDAEDKENAKDFSNESMKLTSLIKRNEELKGGQKELDVDGDGDIEADDLADLRAGKKADESINEEEIKWNAVQNAIINFLKMNTKILDKRVQAKDTDGVKGGLKSIISGLTNAQKSLKLESVNEISVRAGLKLRTYLNGRSDIVDYELVKPNYYNAVKGGKTNLFKVINSTHSKIKVGSTEDFSTDDVKAQLKAGVMTVLKESVNEEITVGKMVKVDNPHWEGALGKKGPFRRKVKMIDGDNVFFTDGSNSSMKYVKESVSSVNEEKYTIIDPKGNSMGAAEKTQVMLAAKKKGGVQSGYFVVSAKNALKAKRALEKFKGDFRNPKLKDMMSNLFYESVNESHFKVGDKVKMSHGGVGVVKSLDKADGADDEKYYNIELPNGDVMKHAPNELKLVESQTKKASMLLKTLMDK